MKIKGIGMSIASSSGKPQETMVIYMPKFKVSQDCDFLFMLQQPTNF